MPSVTDPSLSSPSDSVRYNAETIGENWKPGAVGGKPGERALTLERRSEGVEGNVIGALTVNHAPQQPRPMSLTEMMLHLTNMADALQGERVKISDGMIENNKNLIERKSEEREKMFDKIERMQRKMKRQQKSAETWGWIGTAAGVLITAASMGSLGPIAATCMILSTGVGLGNQIATSAGAYDKLGKNDPDAAKALNYSMFALQIALSLGGFAAASRSATTLAEGGEEIAKGATNAAAKAGGGASKAANIAGETAEAAGKSGSAMSGASSSQQMADDLVKGISDTSRALSKGSDVADEAVDAGQTAARSGANQSSGTAAKSADGASGGAAKGGNATDSVTEADKIKTANALGEHASRIGHATSAVASTKQTVDRINIALLGGAVTRTNADLQKTNRDLTIQRSLLNELVDRLSDQVSQTKEATIAAMESQNKMHNANIAVASNLGANTSQAV